MSKKTGILIKDGTHRIVKVGDVHDMHALLGCTCVACIERMIGGVPYDLWIDDEFLLKADDSFKADAILVSNEWQEIIGGGVLVLNHDGEDIASLGDKDIKRIERNIVVPGKSVTFDYRTSCGTFGARFLEWREFLAYTLTM